jgi:hypothetical protein
MEPILLIHGYSAESKEATLTSIQTEYGSLPNRLRGKYGDANVFDLNLSRYISLDDGVTLDDVARAMQNALLRDYARLLHGRFHVIVHSTGALVIRNWLRLFSAKQSPVLNIVYLAGANFGSGWAHIGQGQLAKWGRYVFEHGAERGLKILDALELGSDATLSMHIGFTKAGNIPSVDYGVQEYILVGSQAHPSLLEMPIPYAKEDGSDGVVRVAGSNLNFNYVRFRPQATANQLKWSDILISLQAHQDRTEPVGSYYEIAETSIPGKDRPQLPFAIPFGCSHTGDDTGIVDGTNQPMRDQVFGLLTAALETPAGSMVNTIAKFDQELDCTYDMVKTAKPPDLLHAFGWNLQAQYDPHAQLIFRFVDQDGKPVPHFDVFFDGGTDPQNKARLQNLFTDTYIESTTKNIIVHFLRTHKYNSQQGEWVSQLDQITECNLEIDFVEPDSDHIKYLPFRYHFDGDQLKTWLTGHRTTIVDIEVLRLPAPEVFTIVAQP